MLKTVFCKLLYEHGNLHSSVNNLRKELDEVQIAIDHDPLNFTLREEEVVYPNAFKDAVLDEERFLKKKEKVEWLKFEGSKVADAFISHFMKFLGMEGSTIHLPTEGLYRKHLHDNTTIDFGKHFVPQQKLSDEQAFRLQTSHPNTDQSASSPVKIEAPRELPKLQAKDTTIEKLKANIKYMNKTSTINSAPGMYKLDPVTLPPNDKNKTHIYYLKHTMERAAILREIVEQAISLNPLNTASYSACKYVKLIQELLGYVRDTCLDIHKPSEKLVVVTPINKKKIVRFAELVISSSTSQKQLGSSQTQEK
ncbi:hypothetical protein Tco_0831092 [Tanacetum coccineum]